MTKEDLSLSLEISPSRPARKRCCSRRHRDTRSPPHPATPPAPPHPTPSASPPSTPLRSDIRQATHDSFTL